jgi:hypothetical protein
VFEEPLPDLKVDLLDGLLPARTDVLPVNLPAFGVPLTHVDLPNCGADSEDESNSLRARDISFAAVPLRAGFPDLTREGASLNFPDLAAPNLPAFARLDGAADFAALARPALAGLPDAERAGAADLERGCTDMFLHTNRDDKRVSV